jgi:hypothetical protein
MVSIFVFFPRFVFSRAGRSPAGVETISESPVASLLRRSRYKIGPGPQEGLHIESPVPFSERGLRTAHRRSIEAGAFHRREHDHPKPAIGAVRTVLWKSA